MKKIVIMTLGLALLGIVLLAAPAKKMIQIKGSDTMVNLVQILAEEYMGKNPGTAIAVLGGGSGTGITGLINQTCDIADHSREWKQKEIDQAWEKGVSPRFFVVAVDGLSIIVNEKNPLEKLTMAEVGALYRGDIKNWKAVGGPDKAVSLYGRQSNSGTYVFMQEYRPRQQELLDRHEGDERQRPDHRGHPPGRGRGRLRRRRLSLSTRTARSARASRSSTSPRSRTARAISPPDKAAVDSGNYPIARPLYQATNGKPKADVAAFIAWEIGPEGQKIVEREGFFTIGATDQGPERQEPQVI